mmetsp:Transcript_2017/g.5092  ORF Transcript_2017/g.5092 Transcript_2017/m.5092 type:complete len:171 (+) Transcript_2017:83-595(+)
MLAQMLRRAARVPQSAPLLRSLTTSAAKPSYSQRMDKTGRPISPHVFIYRFPTIAISSITVRITGMMATCGFAGVAGATLYGGGDWMIDKLQNTQQWAGMDLTAPLKFTIAYIISYQWAGSARHMYWDLTAKGFTNQQMLHSSYAMFGVTTALSLALTMYTLPASEKKQK